MLTLCRLSEVCMSLPWRRGALRLNLHVFETAFSRYCSPGIVSFQSSIQVKKTAEAALVRALDSKHRYQVEQLNQTLHLSAAHIIKKLIAMDEESTASSPESQHVKSDELCKGKWIGLSEITYKDPRGKERKWEGVFRTTKTGDGSDAVVIIPILKRKHKADSVILVNQYRPPLKGYSLEFPAGLIDKGENPQVCAMRELKEETGYTGVATHISPGVSLDPGLANSTVNMVTVEIDGDQEYNRNPEQQQEFIEVISVAVDDLLNALGHYTKRGIVVHSIVYTYAMALSQVAKPVSSGKA